MQSFPVVVLNWPLQYYLFISAQSTRGLSHAISLSLHWWNQPVIHVCNLTCGFFFFTSSSCINIQSFHLRYLKKIILRLYIYGLILSLFLVALRLEAFGFLGFLYASFFFPSSYFYHSSFLYRWLLFLFCLKLCGTHFFPLIYTHMQIFSVQY